MSINSAPTLGFFQDFEAGTGGVIADGSGFGNITRVASGTNGIVTVDGGLYALVTEVGTGPFTRFDGYRSEFVDGLTASVDVYLDPDWSAGQGFNYTVAANGTDGNHQRDFGFHVTKDTDTGELLIGASTGGGYDTFEDLEAGPHGVVTSAGWYTLQHVFRNDGGTLAVDMNLIDADGNIVWTTTIEPPEDVIPAEVGGNRYGWFIDVSVPGGLAIDNLKLGEYAGAVAEIADGAPDEGATTLMADGVIPFKDLDIGDSHSVSVAAGGVGYLGSLSAVLGDSTGDGEGKVTWSFSVADSVLDQLGEGETRTQTYTVTVSDGHGGTASQDVTITLTGAADPGMSLLGGTRGDVLVGSGGDDLIDGALGRDTMSGGLGNDTYWVNEARDVVNESAGQGVDTVIAGLSYTLSANVENLTLGGTGSFFGKGNALDNVIVGNGANNALNGFGGQDTLTGGLGADTFTFSTAADTPANAPDVITDFSAGQRDRIDLRGIDAREGVAGNQAFRFIGTAEFSGNAAGLLRFDAATHMLLGSTDADLDAEIAILLVGVDSIVATNIVL